MSNNYETHGGPAFPRPHSDDQQRNGVDDYPGNAFYDQEGMSLRDYFAAKALVLAINDLDTFPGMAAVAYAMADAMLEARKQ